MTDLPMTPATFCTLAEKLAGTHWRNHLGPMIGKSRSRVYEYANGKRKVPVTVEKLMRLMASQLDD